MKKLLFGVLVFLVLLTAVSMFVNIPYNISTKGIVKPVREWGLYKTFDGTLVNMLEDHLHGTINEYKVIEFQRGDIVRFLFNDQLLQNEVVNQGDTIVWVVSNDLKMNILEKQGALTYEKSLLQVYLTGDKPEALRLALDQVELARQELQTQQQLTERIEHLHRDELVSQQEYELTINELKVKEYRLEIAKSHYESILSGEKEEEIGAIRARIASLEEQMRHLEEHMAGMNILSPINGKLIRERSHADSNEDRLLTVADLSGLLVLAPVDLFEAEFIEKGQEVTVSSSHSRSEFKGQIIDIDNSVQLMNRQPRIFVSILLSCDDARAELLPSLIVDAQIHSPEVSVFEYLVRKSRIVYQN
jgi:hypothetical protein